MITEKYTKVLGILTGKEQDSEDEFEKINLYILGITETKMKEAEGKILNKINILIYSGME